MAQKRLQRSQPGCRPIDAVVDLGHLLVDWRNRGQGADMMTPGPGLLEPVAGSLNAIGDPCLQKFGLSRLFTLYGGFLGSSTHG